MHDVVAPIRFRIERRIGEGGMGVVYQAYDRERAERVALKTLRRMSAEALVRFKREFRSLQDLDHPNLVSLGELLSEGDQWFFSMELVPGVDFLSYVRTAPPSTFDALADTKTFVDPAPTADEVTTPATSSPRATAAPYDEGRLRGGLTQLAEGLGALHAAGKVHRDVKPSNIRVTEESRVVLLDFGLITDVADDSAELDVVGTPAYMAPEQAASKPIGPEADCYALGVLLYQALTGRVPFEGAPLAVLMAKQGPEPPSPREMVRGVPEDLDALCTRLLRHDPAKRPTARDVARALGGPRRPIVRDMPSASGAPLFIGRGGELAALHEAFRVVDAREPVSVLIAGASGIGKSSLAAAFVRSLVAGRGDEIVVLRGRCYEREAVPFKAFDGLVDSIAAYLAHATEEHVAAVIPRHASALARVFPVLRRVRAFAAAPEGTGIDPPELRRRAFAALRDMLGRLADQKKIVTWIDDLQWADPDSLALLREVTRAPDAPALLLLATTRDEGAVASHIQGVRVVRVEPLRDADARELATHLLEAHSVTCDADAIAAEAHGHPLFIDELVRHLALSGAGPQSVLRLDDALAARVRGLGDAARDLTELVAVAGRPLAQETIARAMGAELGAFTRLVAQLRVANLVRTAGARAADGIEPFHDRVREGVLASLDVETRRRHHESLALALEATRGVDPEALSDHWAGAGHEENAAKYALEAADGAARGLAFDRAARLYAVALHSIAANDPRRRALRRKLADALANAGHGERAADEYEAAAASEDAIEALDLRRLAAEQLLRSGHVDRGIEAVRVVLRGVGMELPRSPLVALVSLIFWKIVLALRGLAFRERDPREIAPSTLMRIDMCWSVMFGLSFVDPLLGALFQARHLLLALRAGDPQRVGRALSAELGHEGVQGRRRWSRASVLVERATLVAERVGTPYALGLADFGCGLAYDGNARFGEALARLERAESRLRDCAGTAYEISMLQYFTLHCLALTGRWRELRARQAEYIVDAEGRGNVYGVLTLLIGHANAVCLLDDDAPRARRDAERALEHWPVSGYQIEHFNQMFAFAQADLYEGNAERTLDRLREAWPKVRRAMLFLVENFRLDAIDLRARASIALASRGGPAQGALLKSARTDARRLARDGAKYAGARALLLEAGIARVRGDGATAAKRLREAAPALEACEMVAHAHAARRCLGVVNGGAEGAALIAAADAYFTAEGVRKPARMVALLVPGVGQ